MTGKEHPGGRILGSLRAADGEGVVRMEERFDVDIDDLWSALTDPRRLAHWYGEVEGELHPGGKYRARLFASGWEGTGRVEACDPPRRLRVRTRHVRATYELVIEATLTAVGGQTSLIIEERGMPLDLLAAYGAGDQIHVEDLADYISGRGRRDAEARWDELERAYRTLATGAR